MRAAINKKGEGTELGKTSQKEQFFNDHPGSITENIGRIAIKRPASGWLRQ